jgi:ABC-type maltose transport system permease subunit
LAVLAVSYACALGVPLVGSNWAIASALAARAVVGALPIVLTFLIAQKAIVSGLTQCSVKG